MSEILTKIKENPKIVGIVAGVILLIIVIAFSVKREDYDNDEDENNENEYIQENFEDVIENYEENGDELHLQSMSFEEYDNALYGDVIENFPQKEMNVMYSDSNGNLATTQDLGLKNLTVSGPSNLAGLTVNNKANLKVEGKTDSDGGYQVKDNRTVKPNHLGGNSVQFGFGSMANNGSAPFADYIHFNGWGDASGQNPNLVMFNKGDIGMRIYQGGFNADAPYGAYRDAVMRNSDGRIELGNNWNIRTADGHFRIYYGDAHQFVIHNPNAGAEWANVVWGSRLRAETKVTESASELVPRGVVTMWSGAANAIPGGWALCNGGNGTPNLTNRFIVGAGSSYSVGATGGADTVTLTVDQMPSHTHKLNVIEQSADNVYKANRHQLWGHGSDGANNKWSKEAANDNGNYADYVGIGYKGGSQPHENRPPYYALCYIMKL